MNAETKYAFQKRIKELEQRCRTAEDDLYNFRGAIFEIYDAVIERNKNNGTNVCAGFLLTKIRKCIK